MTGPASHPRMHFHPHDRIGIGFDTPHGVYHRCVENAPWGCRLQRIDQPDLIESFTHEKIAELMASPGWRYRAKYFDPVQAANRARASVDSFHAIPRKELPDVMWRVEWCKRFLALEMNGRSSRSDAAMAAIVPVIAQQIEERTRDMAKRAGQDITLKHPPCARTLRRWIKRFEEGDLDPTALRDNFRVCGSRAPGVSEHVEMLMQKHAVRFADERKFTKTKLYEDLRNDIIAINATRMARGEPVLEEPSFKAFRERIKALSAFDVYAGREGVEAARKKFYMISSGLGVTRPGERVELDEWEISLQALLIRAGAWEKLTPAQRGQVERGKFWLSAALDVATRCMLGLRLLPKANGDHTQPTSQLALATLKMAVSDKSRFAMGVGAASPWRMRCGIETVVTDQGVAYTTHAFHSALTAIGARVEHPPAGVPQLRAHIERAFGTLRTRLIGEFTGQTFANIAERGGYPAEKRASLTLEELGWAIVRHVVDMYHNTPHAGLGGETPREAWDRLAKRYGVVPPPDRDTVRNAFGDCLPPRVLDQRGVRCLNLHFQSQELQAYRRRVGDARLEVILDPDDLGRISVKLGEDGWLTVPCMQSGFDGVPARDWIDATDDLRRRLAGDPGRAASEAVARKALADIQAMAETAIRRADIGATALTEQELARAETKLAIAWSQPASGERAEDGDPDPFADVRSPPAQTAPGHASEVEIDTPIDERSDNDADWTLE